MSGVPVMSRELISHPDFESHDLSSLMALGGGGAQLPPDLVLKIDEQVATARPNTGYGMTETCGIITAALRRLLRRQALERRAGHALLRGQVRRRRRARRSRMASSASCGCAARR